VLRAHGVFGSAFNIKKIRLKKNYIYTYLVKKIENAFKGQWQKLNFEAFAKKKKRFFIFALKNFIF
jgi:hypothetical protein